MTPFSSILKGQTQQIGIFKRHLAMDIIFRRFLKFHKCLDELINFMSKNFIHYKYIKLHPIF